VVDGLTLVFAVHFDRATAIRSKVLSNATNEIARGSLAMVKGEGAPINLDYIGKILFP
jgi:hypothetical protein